jgi:hypothetical protein
MNISTIYIYIYTHTYITSLASNEIFYPSNKIHREVGRSKDLSAPLYSVLLSFVWHVWETGEVHIGFWRGGLRERDHLKN